MLVLGLLWGVGGVRSLVRGVVWGECGQRDETGTERTFLEVEDGINFCVKMCNRKKWHYNTNISRSKEGFYLATAAGDK